MSHWSPPSISSLIENRVAKGDLPPSPSYSIEQSTRSYSPSFYSRADHLSEYRFQPGDADEMPPFPAQQESMVDDSDSDVDEGDEQDQRHSFLRNDFEDDRAGTRLSVMGPRMKLLSRAPWEDGEEEDLHEEDEEDTLDDSRSDTMSTFAKRTRERSRTLTSDSKAGWKSFSLHSNKSRENSSMPASTRMISSPLPLVDSPFGDSCSPSDIGRSPNQSLVSTSQKSSSRRPSAARPRVISTTGSASRTESFVSTATSSSFGSSSIPPLPSPISEYFTTSTPPSPTRSVRRSRKKRDEFPIHPYANPEAYSSAVSLHYPTPHSATYPVSTPSQPPTTPSADHTYPRSESITTIKSSSTTTVLTPSNTLTSSAASFATSTPSSKTTLSPSTPKFESPEDDIPPGMLGFPGSPAYNLITLEQAREKVRGRSKSGGLLPLRKPSLANISEGASENGHSRASAPSAPSPTKSSSFPPPTPSLPSNHIAVEGDSPPLPPLPSQKTLKPKRSGFFRFLKDGKEKGKDRMGEGFVPATPPSTSDRPMPPQEMPPPIPPIPQHYRSPATMLRENASTESNAGPATSTSDFSVSVIAATPPSSSRGRAVAPTPHLESDSSRFAALKRKKSPKPKAVGAQEASTEARDAEFHSLQLRPVSSFFASGLPMDLMFTSPPTTPRDGVESGPARHHPKLDIGIPEGAINDVPEFVSPTTMSSRYSLSTSASTQDPPTPSSMIPLPLPAPHSARGGFGSMVSSSTLGSSSSASSVVGNPQQQVMVLQERLVESRKAWQLQAWEYEAQIRDLQNELEILRSRECTSCGALPPEPVMNKVLHSSGVLDRPRIKTGAGTMFANGGWEGAE